MKQYILEGSFAEGHPTGAAFKEALDAHHAYLQAGFEDGTVLFAGPKVGGGGGVIVVKSDDIETFCANDPLTTAGVQVYKIIEFKKFSCQESVKSWFE